MFQLCRTTGSVVCDGCFSCAMSRPPRMLRSTRRLDPDTIACAWCTRRMPREAREFCCICLTAGHLLCSRLHARSQRGTIVPDGLTTSVDEASVGEARCILAERRTLAQRDSAHKAARKAAEQGRSPRGSGAPPS